MTTSQVDDHVGDVVNRIAEAIESQRRSALIDHAVTEMMWHPVIGEQSLISTGDTLVSAHH